MAALDQAHAAILAGTGRALQHVFHPWTRRVDEAPCHDGARAAGSGDLALPQGALAGGGEQLGPRLDLRAALGGIARIEHDEAAVLDPAVRIDERRLRAGLEAIAQRRAREVDRARGRQLLASAEVVVEEQPEPDEPCGAGRIHLRQHEGQRPDDVRGHAEQALALDQRLADQAELVVFEVAQPAMDQLGAGRGCVAGKVFLLDQQHGQAAPGGIAGNPGAVDPPADDEQVIGFRIRYVIAPACCCGPDGLTPAA